MAGFSQTYSYDKECSTNRWEGRAQTESRWCTADALGRMLIQGNFVSSNPFLGCAFLDVEGS